MRSRRGWTTRSPLPRSPAEHHRPPPVARRCGQPSPQPSRTARSSWRRRAGSAITSIAAIFPPSIVKVEGEAAAVRAAPRPRPRLRSPAPVGEPCPPPEHAGLLGHRPRAADLSPRPAAGRRGRRGARRRGRAPRAALEVAGAGGGQEGVDDLRCRCESAVGDRVASPCTRRRARLASFFVATGERPTMGAIWSNGTANMSCSTNAIRSAGASVSSTTSSARPTESASSASSSGSLPPRGRPDLVGQRCRSSGSSRRDVRERSMSRHTRATTVVSQRPGSRPARRRRG